MTTNCERSRRRAAPDFFAERRPWPGGRAAGAPAEPGHTRLVVWGGLAVLAAAVLGFGLMQRPQGQSGVVEQPRAVFGTPTRELGAEGPDGLCTELIRDGTRRVWTCENTYVSGMPIGRAAVRRAVQALRRRPGAPSLVVSQHLRGLTSQHLRGPTEPNDR